MSEDAGLQEPSPGKRKIVVTLTTVDFRIDQIEPVINSILHQDLKANEVVLYVSKEPYLLDGGIESAQIPDFLRQLENDGKLQIRYTRNIGPYRKLLPYLRENFDNTNIIVTADDDTLYSKTWLSQLYSEYAKRNSIVAANGHGIQFKNGHPVAYRNWGKPNNNKQLANFAIGNGGVLYTSSFFDDWVFRDDFLDVCPLADDVWFKYLTMRTRTPVFVCPKEKRIPKVFNPDKRCLWGANWQLNDLQIRRATEYFGYQLIDFQS